jgi:hypothetical protein
VPGAPFDPALAATAVPAFGRQDGGQLCRPLSNGLVAEDDAALEDHLAELLQREAVAQAPEHDQGDDVGRILGPVQHAGTALIELLVAATAVKVPITVRRAVPLL